MLSDYAIIYNGVVMNVILTDYSNAQYLAKLEYGNDAFAVEVWSHYYPATAQIPCGISDTYSNGKFYDGNGNEIKPVATAEQRIVNTENKLDEHSTAIDDLIIAITPTEAN